MWFNSKPPSWAYFSSTEKKARPWLYCYLPRTALNSKNIAAAIFEVERERERKKVKYFIQTGNFH